MNSKNSKNTVNYTELVAEFHKMMQQPIEKQPIIPNKARQQLRISLIQEELNELEQAFKDGSLIEVLDALADLQYVLSGTILETGMQSVFDKAFAEVHRSNMSKLCNTEEEAKETVKYYMEERGIEAYYTKFGDKFLVNRTDDDKRLKSINYSKANLMQFLDSLNAK